MIARRRFDGAILAWWGLIGLVFGSRCGSAQDSVTAPAGLHYVTFDQYSPLTRNPAFLARVLSPLAAETIRQQLERSGSAVQEQSVDLARERFVTYVPPRPPPRGYALLVFVPPWQDARAPAGWGPVLDREGMIFVSAARSGNDESAVARREPLALIEAANIVRRYKVDPERIYVGGFSGGARIAMRIALAFPDVFRGALLDAGSDPIGAGDIPLPAAELMSRFQESTRLVYVTGARDAPSLTLEAESTHSMEQNCVYDIDRRTPPWSGHDVIGPEVLSQALASLSARAQGRRWPARGMPGRDPARAGREAAEGRRPPCGRKEERRSCPDPRHRPEVRRRCRAAKRR